MKTREESRRSTSNYVSKLSHHDVAQHALSHSVTSNFLGSAHRGMRPLITLRDDYLPTFVIYCPNISLLSCTMYLMLILFYVTTSNVNLYCFLQGFILLYCFVIYTYMYIILYNLHSQPMFLFFNFLPLCPLAMVKICPYFFILFPVMNHL